MNDTSELVWAFVTGVVVGLVFVVALMTITGKTYADGVWNGRCDAVAGQLVNGKCVSITPLTTATPRP